MFFSFFSYLTQERAVQLLQREILELNCQQQKYTQLFNMLDLPLKRLGETDPPVALELHDLSNDKVSFIEFLLLESF